MAKKLSVDEAEAAINYNMMLDWAKKTGQPINKDFEKKYKPLAEEGKKGQKKTKKATKK